MILGQKQREGNDRFIYTWQNIKSIVSKKEIDNKIDLTLHKMRKILTPTKKYGSAWSGGKDSVVVDFLCRRLERNYPSCIGMTHDLEYPEFMQYVTDHMPPDLKVYNSGHSLKWLSNNLHMLFPKDSNIAKHWFVNIQHKAQNKFWKDKNLDVLITGRRKKDSNYCGKEGLYKNKGTGVVRYSPIYDWTHEETLAVMAYYNLPVAPFYSWINGWVVGSGCWAARQWTGSIQKGWHEVYSIDPNVVKEAATLIPSAEEYVRNMGI